MAGRRGIGRVRHIHTPCLWLQRAVADDRVVLDKILGTDNPADLGTKSLGKQQIEKILSVIGYRCLAGTSRLALRAQV